MMAKKLSDNIIFLDTISMKNKFSYYTQCDRIKSLYQKFNRGSWKQKSTSDSDLCLFTWWINQLSTTIPYQVQYLVRYNCGWAYSKAGRGTVINRCEIVGNGTGKESIPSPTSGNLGMGIWYPTLAAKDPCWPASLK